MRAPGPPCRKRWRQRVTVGRLTPTSRAIRLLATPAAARRAILARRATLWGVLWARTQASSVRRCSGNIGRGSADFGMELSYPNTHYISIYLRDTRLVTRRARTWAAPAKRCPPHHPRGPALWVLPLKSRHNGRQGPYRLRDREGFSEHFVSSSQGTRSRCLKTVKEADPGSSSLGHCPQLLPRWSGTGR